MYFIFNKSDNSYSFHTQDENDVNIQLILNPATNYLVHIPDFDVSTHQDLYGEDDICCLFWDSDTQTTYIDKTFFNPNYSHGKAYLVAALRDIASQGDSVQPNQDQQFLVDLAAHYLDPVLFKEIYADGIIDANEASQALEDLLNEIVNEVSNGDSA